MKDIRLVIGNKNYSSWSMCPWLLLKMFDVDFEEIQIALFQDNTAEKLGPYSPSLKVPVCSCVVLITFSNVVSRTWVFASQPLTVPVCVVRVFAFAKVPVTSFKT